MSYMFHNAEAFAQDITGWFTPALTQAKMCETLEAKTW